MIDVLTSLILAHYYLCVVVMYMREGDPTMAREPWLDLTTALTAVVTVVFCIVPAPLFAWASETVLKLF